MNQVIIHVHEEVVLWVNNLDNQVMILVHEEVVLRVNNLDKSGNNSRT